LFNFANHISYARPFLLKLLVDDLYVGNHLRVLIDGFLYWNWVNAVAKIDEMLCSVFADLFIFLIQHVSDIAQFRHLEIPFNGCLGHWEQRFLLFVQNIFSNISVRGPHPGLAQASE
jgi:hypothetical protein